MGKGWGKESVDIKSTAQSKEKNDKLDFIKIKKKITLCENITLREIICKLHMSNKLYPEYVKNSYNSMVRKLSEKMGKRLLILSRDKIYFSLFLPLSIVKHYVYYI